MIEKKNTKKTNKKRSIVCFLKPFKDSILQQLSISDTRGCSAYFSSTFICIELLFLFFLFILPDPVNLVKALLQAEVYSRKIPFQWQKMSPSTYCNRSFATTRTSSLPLLVGTLFSVLCGGIAAISVFILSQCILL